MPHNQNETDQESNTAMTIDPVITWLEQIRNFMGSTPAAKDMAQRAIDRLHPPAVDPWTIVGAIVDDLGTLRATDGAVISDRPHHPSSSADDAGYYGGYMVAESITRRNAIAFAFVPQLLVMARDHPSGRAVIAQIAAALQEPSSQRIRVRDRLDGTYRLARLAHEFQYAGDALAETDPFYLVAKMLERIAQGLLDGGIAQAAADVTAWLDAKREAASRAGRTGVTS